MARRVDVAGWTFLVILLLIQYGLFRQHALRNIVWSYPPNHDQVNFLEQSYVGYEKVRELGPRLGFAKELELKRAKPARRAGEVVLPARPQDMSEPPPVTRAVGLMLPLQVTTLYFLVGPGRMTALSLNFFYFAVFQASLVGALRWLSGRWCVAFVGLGLLLCAQTPFFWAGGLDDFRLDFISFCLFGTFLCAVMRSRVFADRKWSIVAGAVGALLFTFRFITIVYLAGAMGVVVAFLWLRTWRRISDANVRRHGRRQLHNALITCAIIAGVAIPVLAGRWKAIRDYYVVGHVTGQEKEVRAREQGVNNWRDAIAFYPKSLVENHAGRTMLRWCAYLLAAAALAMLVQLGTGARTRPPFDAVTAWIFLGGCLLVPLAALTADTAKSPVVANIMVGPLALLVMLAIILLAGTYRHARQPLVVQIGMIVLAVLVMREGMLLQVRHELRRPADPDRPAQVQKLLGLCDEVADDALAMGWDVPSFAFDSSSDALNFKVFEVMAFERRGESFRASEVLANTIFKRNPGEVEHRLQCADFAVLGEVSPNSPPSPYDFDRSMQAVKPELFAWCRQHMIELKHEHMGSPFDRDVTLFVRPAVRVVGQHDGWLARTGTRITVLAEVLRQRPKIELRGKNQAARLKVPPHVTARLDAGDRVTSDVPAELRYGGDDYRLSLRVDPAMLPATGAVEIELTFDSAFVPRNVSDSDDDRELVARLPDEGSLLP